MTLQYNAFLEGLAISVLLKYQRHVITKIYPVLGFRQSLTSLAHMK